MESKIIPISADHAGYELKQEIIKYLKDINYTVKDYGTNSLDSCDYPDYIHPLAKAINNGEYAKGIIICGSANGVSITANKYENVRSAICWLPQIAALARQHNDANVLALPSRFVKISDALIIVDTFLATAFEGGRHQIRVDKIKRK
ncbi:MAG: ribose 5-phosphate isomerase B [Bacteroidia bacterium]|nr:ribose 5-phosphate isomerase B [Bacteroidia bacterium]